MGIFNQNNQKITLNILLLFVLAYQGKNDDEDKNNGDGDKEDEVGRHGLLIWNRQIIWNAKSKYSARLTHGGLFRYEFNPCNQYI